MPLRSQLLSGLVIPAHPLALDHERKLDERRQRALTRYYLAAGAGGLAVGVHTTQFAIRDPKIGLFRRVLELAAEELRSHLCQDAPTSITHHASRITERQSLVTSAPTRVGVAGICGQTKQAVAEATLLRELGFDAGLLSLAALKT